MLVLLRKKNESVVIANEITVTVVDIREDKVRLGFVMPKDIPIHRQEVHDEIYKTQPKPTLGLPRKTPSEDPWHPRSDEPASASSNERRSQFLGRVAWSIREKSAIIVSLGAIAQTLIDACQNS